LNSNNLSRKNYSHCTDTVNTTLHADVTTSISLLARCGIIDFDVIGFPSSRRANALEAAGVLFLARQQRSAQSIALNGGGLRRTVTKLDAMTAQWVDDPVAADYRARQLLERSTPKDIKSRSRRAI
jgi:hypothetical protein